MKALEMRKSSLVKFGLIIWPQTAKKPLILPTLERLLHKGKLLSRFYAI
jgi:hypothetical protein